MPTAAQEETSTVVVGVPALDQGHLTVTDTIGQVADLVVMKMTAIETEALAEIAIVHASVPQAPSLNHQHLNQRKMSVIGGLSLCNSLPLD